MGKVLPGAHYCAEHQGNHSYYAPENCLVCLLEEKYNLECFLRTKETEQLKAENMRLRKALMDIKAVLSK